VSGDRQEADPKFFLCLLLIIAEGLAALVDEYLQEGDASYEEDGPDEQQALDGHRETLPI